MFRFREIAEAVGGQLLSGEQQSVIKGVSIDSRTIKQNELFVALTGERFNGHDFIQQALNSGAGAVVFSRNSRFNPGRIAKDLRGRAGFIAVADTRIALGRLARFHRQRFNLPVIAITGSNGKTTVKDMLAWILSSRARVLKNPGTQNNDIGIPLTLLRLDVSHDIAVLELGTNHFGEIAYLANIAKPGAGIITNIGPAHLEFLKDLRGVYKEKTALLRGLDAPRIAVLNADEPGLRRLKNSKKIFAVTYGIKNKSDFRARGIRLTSRQSTEFKISSKGILGSKARARTMELNTLGSVNIYNALAGIAASRLLGWDYEIIRKRLKTFVFPRGRLNTVKLGNVSFIDDTYNANPASLSEALHILGKFKVRGRRIFVMGDMLELGKYARELHYQAGSQIARVCDAFISVGELARFAGIRAVKMGLSRDCVFNCPDSRQAADLLFSNLKPDNRDLILVKGSRLMRMEEVLKQKG